jgi:hypothetical protein
MKLTRMQILMVINLQGINKDFSNYHDQLGYYVETGKYKPYSKSTVLALLKKGIIVVTKITCNSTIYFVKHGPKFDTIRPLTWDEYNSRLDIIV